MSGSGSGGGDWRPTPKPVEKPTKPSRKSGEGGGSGGPADPCNIVETTNLNSPQPLVLAGLRPGTVLEVEYRPGPPRLLVAVTAQGVVAGSITSPSMPQIIQCIQAGHEYVAEIVNVRGAQCQVEIHPK